MLFSIDPGNIGWQAPNPLKRETNIMTERTGRCLCGAVSFKLVTEPLATRICWCRDCQHLAANGSVNLLVPTDGLSFSGVLSEYTKIADSGDEVTRQFCPKCGAPVRQILQPSRVPGGSRGNLDDPSSIQPSMNIWAASAPGWACLDPALEREERQPMPPK